MARMLSLEDYGILSTLFAILYILTAFTDSIQTIITKYTIKENKDSKIKNLFNRSIKKSLIISSLLFIFYLIISVFFSPILKIPYLLLAFNGLLIFTTFLIPIPRGILQGKKWFAPLGISAVFEGIVKLFLAVFFVYAGWRIYGAITATILSVLFAFFFSLICIRKITNSKEERAKAENIYGYTKPIFLITIMLMLFYSLDLIIAKIVFPSNIAGAYAIASIISKTLFLATQPIGKAMFPITAEKKTKKNFLYPLLLLFACLLVSLLFIYFFPEFIIKLFAGRPIPESSSILFILSLSIAILSISNLILQYKMSQNKLRGYIFLFIVPIIEMFLLSCFSQNLMQFAIAFLTCSAALLWASIFIIRE